jgi:hypothetical protein
MGLKQTCGYEQLSKLEIYDNEMIQDPYIVLYLA